MPMADKATPIVYREYQFDNDFPILFMQGKHIAQRLDFVHFHNCLEIAVCVKGAMAWNLENREYALNPGEICLIPPYFTHASAFLPQQEEELLCSYLFFNPEQLLAPMYPGGLPGKFLWYRYMDFQKIINNRQAPEEACLINMIITELIKEEAGYRETVRGLAEALMVLLSRRSQDGPAFIPKTASIPQLIPAVSYLDREYASTPDTAELARLCGLSERQFLSSFREFFCQTPMQYLRTLRIQKACHLLTGTEDSILSVSLQTGFNSLSGFNRCFRKICGRSPQDFRRELRGIAKDNPRRAPFKAVSSRQECLPPAVSPPR